MCGPVRNGALAVFHERGPGACHNGSMRPWHARLAASPRGPSYCWRRVSPLLPALGMLAAATASCQLLAGLEAAVPDETDASVEGDATAKDGATTSDGAMTRDGAAPGADGAPPGDSGTPPPDGPGRDPDSGAPPPRGFCATYGNGPHVVFCEDFDSLDAGLLAAGWQPVKELPLIEQSIVVSTPNAVQLAPIDDSGLSETEHTFAVPADAGQLVLHAMVRYDPNIVGNASPVDLDFGGYSFTSSRSRTEPSLAARQESADGPGSSNFVGSDQWFPVTLSAVPYDGGVTLGVQTETDAAVVTHNVSLPAAISWSVRNGVFLQGLGPGSAWVDNVLVEAW